MKKKVCETFILEEIKEEKMQKYKKGALEKTELKLKELFVEEDTENKKEGLILDLETDFNVKIVHNIILRYYLEFVSDDKEMVAYMSKKKGEYLNDVKDIIDEYQYITSEADKKQLMLKFLNKAKIYYDISYKYDEKIANKCLECGEPDPQEYCFKCGLVVTKVKEKTVTKKKNKKDDSEKLKNLERVMEDYEGRRPLNDDDEDQLKSLFGDQKLERDQVMKLLSENKLTPLKKQMNRIMHNFFGEEPPSLDDKRDILRAKFLLVDEIYWEIKPESKSNSLSINVIFYFLLLTEHLSIATVELPKTTDSLVEQIGIITEASIILSIRYPDFDWDFEFSYNQK